MEDPLPERARLTATTAELASGASPAIEPHRGVAVESIARKNGKVEVVLKTAPVRRP